MQVRITDKPLVVILRAEAKKNGRSLAKEVLLALLRYYGRSKK